METLVSTNDRAQSFAKRARLYARSGEFGEACRCFETALNLAPDIDPYEKAELLIALAHAYENQRDFPRAVQRYKDALDTGGVALEGEIWHCIGGAYVRAGQFTDAADALARAKEAHVQFEGDLDYTIAANLLKMGRFAEAVDTYSLALTEDRYTVEDWEIHNAIGLVSVRLGNYGNALEHLQKTLDSGLYDIAGNIHNNLGETYLSRNQKGDQDSALAHFRAATEDPSESTSGFAYHKIGEIHEANHRLTQALAAYRRAKARYEIARNTSNSPAEVEKEIDWLDSRIADLGHNRCFQHGEKCPLGADTLQDDAVFVIMPFGNTKESHDHYKEVYDAIEAVAKSCGLYCTRADAEGVPGDVMCRVCRDIKTAGIIIADLSEQNPNVYYELGHAHELDKTVIPIVDNAASLRFDVSGMGAIVYGGGLDVLERDLSTWLRRITQA